VIAHTCNIGIIQNTKPVHTRGAGAALRKVPEETLAVTALKQPSPPVRKFEQRQRELVEERLRFARAVTAGAGGGVEYLGEGYG
jgi:hypothetical protein